MRASASPRALRSARKWRSLKRWRRDRNHGRKKMRKIEVSVFIVGLFSSGRWRPAVGSMKRPALENLGRSNAISWWHQSCTTKMGRVSISVVDANLKVYGIGNLRIADGSIMPRMITGNTMAPCVIIGERAAEVLRADHIFLLIRQ